MHSVRAQPFRFLGPLILAGLLLASSAALAAGESLQDLFQAERFDEVIERGQIATGQDGGDGEAWFFLGRALLQTGKYKKAQEALAHAVEQSFRPAYSRFHLAVAAAHRKRTAEALEALDAAVKAGFLQVEGLEDPAFDGFRTSRQFLDIAERQKAQAMPCLYDDRYRQWDFWLGNWNVLGVDGSPQGRNTIQLTENGCALIETWTSASGGSGTSVNYFDPKTSKWNQIWVD
ncbi:MAG: tetratricopeptide repeat protein, partial [Acidobacteriota bacterium]|nr:tetratricopeptide repeat protein [Acidobacteriota bacterium]